MPEFGLRMHWHALWVWALGEIYAIAVAKAILGTPK